MSKALKTPAPAAAPKATAAPAKPAAPATSNADQKAALSASSTPYAQAMEQFKAGIPDAGKLCDALEKLSAAEKQQIASNAGYMAQIDARAPGDLKLAIYAALGMADGEGPESESEEASAPKAAAKPAPAAPPAPAKAVS